MFRHEFVCLLWLREMDPFSRVVLHKSVAYANIKLLMLDMQITITEMHERMGHASQQLARISRCSRKHRRYAT